MALFLIVSFMFSLMIGLMRDWYVASFIVFIWVFVLIILVIRLRDKLDKLSDENESLKSKHKDMQAQLKGLQPKSFAMSQNLEALSQRVRQLEQRPQFQPTDSKPVQAQPSSPSTGIFESRAPADSTIASSANVAVAHTSIEAILQAQGSLSEKLSPASATESIASAATASLSTSDTDSKPHSAEDRLQRLSQTRRNETAPAPTALNTAGTSNSTSTVLTPRATRARVEAPPEKTWADYQQQITERLQRLPEPIRHIIFGNTLVKVGVLGTSKNPPPIIAVKLTPTDHLHRSSHEAT